ncbi:hypothetical protein BKA83DRAFT_4057556 [Pisolithus microcarpus]|nr:hypothetical protein BKA83DRAFT_4057556 [Pisolithus microcarpus]
MTCAYAFTDYHSQGQTISHVVVDIARPLSGGLNLFNLYVALSRSSGQNTIRLLRDFDEKLFMGNHSSDLLASHVGHTNKSLVAGTEEIECRFGAIY